MEIQETLSRLVRFKSVTNNTKENKELIDWFLKQADGLPLHIKRHEFDGFPSATLTTRKTKTPVLWLLAHTDVVPAPDTLFEPRADGTRMYGRGTYDMKFAIACYLKLLRELGTALPEYDFGIMLTSDEETGGEHGAKKLVENGYLARVVFDGDGSENWQVESKVKGLLHYEVISRGVAAHGSRPWEGVNALRELIHFLTHLERYFKKGNRAGGFQRTMSITMLHAGEATNLIPDIATARIDIRYTSDRELAKIKARTHALAQRRYDITPKILAHSEHFAPDFANPYIQEFLSLMPTQKLRRQRGAISHGSSDACFFATHNIPTIVTRPVGGGIHRDNEWVDVKDVEKFYSLLYKYVTTITKTNE